MGMLIVYGIGRQIFPGVGAGFPPAEAYGEQVVAIFLDGIRARSST
jgi:hypothetical protein